MTERKGQQGFTLVEAALVAGLLAVLMASISSVLGAAQNSIKADDKIAVAMESLQRTAVRTAQILRPCSISTYRVPATAADVPLYAGAAGEWMEPIEADPRPAVRFQSANGQLSLNAAELTGVRSLYVQPENGETPNGVDDDGDGLIDEGRLMLDYDGVPVAWTCGIESCAFPLTGRLLTIELRSAVPGRAGAVQRFAVREVLYLRNN